MTASGSRRETTPSSSGWDARLYWKWIAYNTIAFIIVLTTGFVLILLDDEVLTWTWPATTS
ncbi:hypothetical protein [Streptomyces sp. NPDC051000]|uniref:hypothetical protein n=1 Tax=Streptomyces sp. NPDC051000 TaxID=3155520 RepID=UPI00340D6000